MSVSEWKTINFFNLEPRADSNKLSNIKDAITSNCYNTSFKVFCDASGWVYVYSRNWEYSSFKAHDSAILVCAITEGTNILVTVEQQAQKNEVFLQVFNLNKITKRSGAPIMAKATLETFSSVTVLSALPMESYVCIAMGYERGEISLHRAGLSRDITSAFRSFPVSLRPITGLQFKQKDAQSCNMFVCSDGGIFCYTITENNSITDTKVVLDNKQEASRCCGLSKSRVTGENYFIIGRDDAVYCFTCDGRGPCYAIDGVKKCMAWNSNYLIVIMQPDKIPFASKTSSVIVVIDIQNKMIVFNKEVEAVMHVIVDSMICYIITDSCKVYTLRERDMQSKVRLLISKNFYDIALRLLESADGDKTEIANIYMDYGHYFLLKGKIKLAVEKYIKTIGTINPFCIIQKLLDSRYNIYLAEYLRELNRSGCASYEHIKLLQNCHERLNLPGKIQDMYCSSEPDCNILQCDKDNTKEDQNIKEHCMATNVNINTFLSPNYNESHICQLISKELNEEQIYKFFIDNGQKLMHSNPSKLTNVLKSLCSDSGIIEYPERFVPLLLTNTKYCKDYLDHIVENCANRCNNSIYNLLFEMYLQEWKESGQTETEKLIYFLKSHQVDMNIEHIIIICKHFQFWGGILYIYEHIMRNRLCLRQFIKTSGLQNASVQSEHCFDIQMWLQTISKNELTTEKSVQLINSMLNYMLMEKNQSVLQILRTVASNSNILVSHVKDFFSQEHLQELAETNYKNNNTKLCDEMDNLTNLLLNFSHNPIEFRSSICDQCRRQLKLPVIYYICQHSFHKDCISAYSQRKACTSCANTRPKSQCDTISNGYNAFKTKMNSTDTTNNLIDNISIILGSGIFTKMSNVNTMTSISETDKIATTNAEQLRTGHWAGRFVTTGTSSFQKIQLSKPTVSVALNPFEEETNGQTLGNPFGEYDSNLNWFAE